MTNQPPRTKTLLDTTTTKPALFHGNWIQTVSNRRFFPLDPNPNDIDINDIAHALSMKCRFSGHTSQFYSVAQHSVLVSYACNPEDALWGLLHDAEEAYLVDMPKPLKVLPEFQWFVDVSAKVQLAVCKRFGLNPVEPPSVKRADKQLLMTEKRDLMSFIDISEWQIKYEEVPLTAIIDPLLPIAARDLFLARYRNLTTNL